MNKIAILGIGLIGGSLALSLKGKPDLHIAGFDISERTLQESLRREVVDETASTLEEATADADFIFLCMPVGLLEHYIARLRELPLKPGCIVSDVGSTKAGVTRCAETLQIGAGVHFIGGHPMAGKEKSGVEAATSRLFENAFYVLTPTEKTPPEAYERLASLLRLTRAHIVKVDAARHDDIVGAISHLPHIIAVALVNQISAYNETNPLYRELAAGGFRDITRIASSDPIVWRDILTDNKDVLLGLLADWNEEIGRFIRLLEQADGAGIEREFRKANRFRDELPERRKGVIFSLYEIYIDVPDEPGIVGQVATLLGNERINLSNIQIIESREDVPGVLRLSFRDQCDMEKALELLRGRGYAVHV